jgi:hypothetical protein
VSVPDSILAEQLVDEPNIPRACLWTADTVLRIVYLPPHKHLYHSKGESEQGAADESSRIKRHGQHFTLKRRTTHASVPDTDQIPIANKMFRAVALFMEYCYQSTK